MGSEIGAIVQVGLEPLMEIDSYANREIRVGLPWVTLESAVGAGGTAWLAD